MCNYMGCDVSRAQYIRLKGIEKELGTIAALKELEIMKSGFAYSNSAIIKKAGPDDIEIVSAHWEFIPSWIKNMSEVEAARKQGIPWLNAKAENLLTSKMWRPAALSKRCLVIASHFYEWRHYKPEGAKKELTYPYAITANDQDYFYMAGIYNTWTNKSTGEIIDTFAIVTTAANDLMKVVHNKKERMPTILPENLAWEWIMEDLTEERIQQIASYQLPSEEMHAYTIAKDFREAQDPLAPFEYEDLPDLDIAV